MLGCTVYGEFILGDVTYAFEVVSIGGAVAGGTGLVTIVSILESTGGAVAGGDGDYKRIVLMIPSGGGLGGGFVEVVSKMGVTSYIEFTIRVPIIDYRILSDPKEIV